MRREPTNLFWVYQNGTFSTGKKHFTPGKKIRKNDFSPSEKNSCYAPDSPVFESGVKKYRVPKVERPSTYGTLC